MNTWRTHADKSDVIIAAVLIAALAGCGPSSNQAPFANTNVVAAAPEAAPGSAPQAPSGPSQTQASSAPAAPNKGNTRTCLSHIHHVTCIANARGELAMDKHS